VRRGLGRGRTLIAIGAILGAMATFLPWITVAGAVRDPRPYDGFIGPGGIMFLSAVAMLAIIVLPYTTKTRRALFDRAVVYLVLLVVALGALAMTALDLIAIEGNKSLAPLDAPGLWLAMAGMALTTWGVLELFAEPPPAL
jgi:hypothetical protein